MHNTSWPMNFVSPRRHLRLDKKRSLLFGREDAVWIQVGLDRIPIAIAAEKTISRLMNTLMGNSNKIIYTCSRLLHPQSRRPDQRLEVRLREFVDVATLCCSIEIYTSVNQCTSKAIRRLIKRVLTCLIVIQHGTNDVIYNSKQNRFNHWDIFWWTSKQPTHYSISGAETSPRSIGDRFRNHCKWVMYKKGLPFGRFPNYDCM